MLTHDALNTYVADRQQARMQAATASRTAAMLRRARKAIAAAGPTPSPNVTAPASVAPVSSPAVAHATGATRGMSAGVPVVAALRTTAPTGTPAVPSAPAA